MYCAPCKLCPDPLHKHGPPVKKLLKERITKDYRFFDHGHDQDRGREEGRG